MAASEIENKCGNFQTAHQPRKRKVRSKVHLVTAHTRWAFQVVFFKEFALARVASIRQSAQHTAAAAADEPHVSRHRVPCKLTVRRRAPQVYIGTERCRRLSGRMRCRRAATAVHMLPPPRRQAKPAAAARAKHE